jgi:hypothetical protein
MAASKAHAQSEWHLWFAWYPVMIWVEGKPARVWLRYVQRKLGTSRITGEPKWRYRLGSTSQSTPSCIDEDAPERSSRVWLLSLIVIIGVLIAFGPVFFFR